MPELPEVETTRQGILPHIKGQQVSRVTVRQASLRWPVSEELADTLPGQQIRSVHRRGKYLLLVSDAGTLLVHLGMSGSLRILPAPTAAGSHDHVDIEFGSGAVLRYTDPRRFGCLLWTSEDIDSHFLLARLGPEPLLGDFSGEYLWRQSRGRKVPVKTFIMNSQVVVGVGNIYANEALFVAGIHPHRAAGRISRQRYEQLVTAIKTVLERAIAAGGTTLRDFTDSDGKPGYFSQSLAVYGRSGEACQQCGDPLRESRLGGRSTVYCRQCQR